ncbi:MAG: HD domain-containing protein [Lachnospiraceae bacterium]|nr:HD domain-containing protein [Lachnospiraceae bacterium]
MTAREFLDILHVAERLKDTPRHCTTSKGRVESVAEHSWRIALMAMLLRDEFPELDMDRVTRMCLIHDLGECFTGDIPTFNKTKADEEREISLLREWVASLPAEVSEEFSDLYREMDALETPEAILYKSLDKLEAVIQHNESPISTWEAREYELNQTYAFDIVAFSEWLTELRREMLADTLEKIANEQTEKTDRSSDPSDV